MWLFNCKNVFANNGDIHVVPKSFDGNNKHTVSSWNQFCVCLKKAKHTILSSHFSCFRVAWLAS